LTAPKTGVTIKEENSPRHQARKIMNLSSAARKNFVEELIAFETAAMEVRDRFYAFLVTHDPKGYADYGIYPFANSPAPLWRGYFKLVPYLADVMYDEMAAEPSNSLCFQGPLDKTEIKYAKQAAKTFSSFSDNDKPQGAHPEAEEEIRNLPDSFSPFIEETQNEWNDQRLYINIPDAYLDDPDGWEAEILSAMAKDRELAQNALETLYGAEAASLGFTVTRRGPEDGHDYIKVKLNSADMNESHWEAFKLTVKGETPLLFVSHTTGHIFDTRVPYHGYKNPEKESRTFMGTTTTV
jgi:hypothetical protein